MKRKVQVWIHDPSSGRVLILRTKPERGGFWQPVTGGVEEGEALEKAAMREAVEETGLSFPSLAIPLGYEFEFEGRFGRARETAFALACDSQQEPRLDGQEHDAAAWVTPEEAQSRIRFPSNQEALARLTRMLLGR